MVSFNRLLKVLRGKLVAMLAANPGTFLCSTKLVCFSGWTHQETPMLFVFVFHGVELEGNREKAVCSLCVFICSELLKYIFFVFAFSLRLEMNGAALTLVPVFPYGLLAPKPAALVMYVWRRRDTEIRWKMCLFTVNLTLIRWEDGQVLSNWSRTEHCRSWHSDKWNVTLLC